MFIGGCDGVPRLGEDVFDLRRMLGERIGEDAAGGVPEAFWIEAYAAQLVLDLRTGAPASAAIPLWPAAIARLPIGRDLPMLDEIDRLLAPLVRVTGVRSDAAEAAFAALGASAGSARRLAAAYRGELRWIAREAGWPLLER